MYIAGMGIVFNRGRGLTNLEKALTQGWVKPNPVYRVPAEALADKQVLKEARRADNLSKMATLSAFDALADSGLPEKSKSNLGIILATAFGPHVTTFGFLDDILTYGDAGVSPTLFSHSVHNAAASYIALNLQTRGPTLTMTQFADSFQQAIILAESWLEEKRCEYILVGSVDQTGKVMEYICSQKLKLAQDGRIKPFSFSPNPAAVPGEGSAFFLVTNNAQYNKYCSISGLPAEDQEKDDLYILDSDGMCGDETLYKKLGQTNIPLVSYAPIFGSMLTLSSFSCMAAALMLKNQKTYASPIQDNPHNFNILTRHQTLAVHKIKCLRYNCYQEELAIRLKTE
ncbi:MAG TPA: beta-ketoacyl synthase N-terminal-like domain-containing protein [Candidatus Omnitrophota bacterium]|nr:beta-ketoacyl synthase N-terminal-like domain-containing protein [Candidatus Omnitrophota bacterium]HPT39826.1 beta-ketoacyl synthase N-terminal-like domain-containing protein [Candidatus Omnitrophota bacterium]